MNSWGGVFLGIFTWLAAGGSVVSATIAVAAQPATSEPTTSRPASVMTTEELEAHTRLITDNNTPEARTLGARKLLSAGSAEAARRLVRILESPTYDLSARQAVCRAIAESDATAFAGQNHAGANGFDPPSMLIDPLLDLLGDHPDALDKLIEPALRRFERQTVITKLQAIAQDASSDLSKRKAAVMALGNMGDELQAIGALMSALRNDGVRIRAFVLEALAQATGVRHESAESALIWWESHKTMTSLQWLREVNARRVEERNLLRAEKAVLTNRLVTAYREAYLQTPESQRPEKLSAFLKDDSVAVRGLGLDLINLLITDRKEVGQAIKSRLVEMISDPDPGLRRNVAAMVGDLRPPGAEARLLEALARENDYRVRGAQVNALGRLDKADAIPNVIVCLDDESQEVVAEAAQALGALARQGHDLEPQVISTVASALLSRFENVAMDDENLRVKLLEAMGRIGHESFFLVFKQEMEPHRSVRIRSAAISGMSALRASSVAADVIRPYITAAEPEVRQAVAQALGRCGRNPEDVKALAGRLDSTQETVPGVRERAWDSYTAILRRSPASVQLEKSARFAESEDPTDQRRALTLLANLKSDQSRLDELAVDDRGELSGLIAHVQFNLGDYQTAAKSYEEALLAVQNPEGDQAQTLRLKLAKTLLRLARDEEALTQLKAASAGETAQTAFSESVMTCLLEESKRRLTAAQDAPQFAALLELLESAESLSQEILPESDQQSCAEQLAKVEEKVLAKREATVESLLGAIATDPDAESKIVAYGRQIALPKVHSRLSNIPTTNPATDNEARLIALARKLVPDWPGYEPGCPPEERDAALEKLKTGAVVPTAETPSMTTTPPV